MAMSQPTAVDMTYFVAQDPQVMWVVRKVYSKSENIPANDSVRDIEVMFVR
jgi:hypothetical protein